MPVRREQEGPVGVVTLDRPERMNSFDLDHVRELADAVAAVAGSEASRAVLLTSAGERAFCTGADLAAFREALEAGEAPELVREVSETMNRAILELARGGKPTVAAVDGVAAGGGLGLALACDLRVASRRARFTPAFLDAGVSPDGGATWFLPRMVGQARARELVLANRTLDADQAREWGLVGEVVAAERTDKRALERARRLAEGPAKATAWAKDRLLEGRRLEEHLAYETEATAASAATGDFREGVEAFLEGREPAFE